MFKTLKDRLAKEVKQSPMKITSSVQQFAQAVVDRTTNNLQDQFSIDDSEDTPQNSPSKFQSVDLVSPTSSVQTRSRRDSMSSVTSEASSIFPVLDSTVTFHLQSDFESASEVEENFSSQLDRINKEQLFNAYKRTQLRYQKYKSKFQELATHYRDLEREHIKAKNILTDCQDKAIRRIGELKEQCFLEQKAKAHLEEALRNDIEEKDHHIAALKTKISLLKSSQDNADYQDQTKDELLIDLSHDEKESQTQEIHLTDKIKKLEAILLKYKGVLKENSEKIDALEQEKNKLREDSNSNSSSDSEFFKKSLNDAQITIKNLNETIELLKKREQENALSLAENKLSIHRELEKKEEQIKHLQDSLEKLQKEKDDLFKDKHSPYITDEIKENLIQDLSKSNSDAIQMIQEQMKIKITDLQNKMDEELKLKTNEINELQIEKKHLLDKIQNCEKQINENNPEKNLDNLNKLIDDLKKNISEKDNEITHLSEEMVNSKERENIFEKKANDFEKTVHELDELRDKFNEESSRFVKLTEDFDVLSLSGHKKEQEIFQLNQEKISLEKELEQNILNNKNLKNNYEALLEIIHSLKLAKSTMFNSLKDINNVFHKDFNDFKSNTITSINDFVMKKQNLMKENYEKNINGLQSELDKYKEDLESKNKIIFELKNELDSEREMKILGHEKINEELERKNMFLKEKVEEINSLQLKLDHFKTQIVALNDMENEYNSIKKQYEDLENQNIVLTEKNNILLSENDNMKSHLNNKDHEYEIKFNELINLKEKNIKEIEDLKLMIEEQNKKFEEENSKEKTLEDLRNEIIKYKKTIEEINLNNQIIQNELSEKELEIANQQEKINSFKNLESDNIKLTKDLNIMKEKIQAYENDHQDNKNLSNELEQLKSTNINLTSQLSELFSKLEQSNEIQENDKIKIIEYENKIANLYKDLTEIEIKHSKRVKEFEENYDQLSNTNSLLSSKNEEMESNIKDQNEKIDNLKENLNKIEKEKQELIKTKDLYIDLEKEYKSLNEQYSEMVKNSDSLKKQLSDFNDLKQSFNKLKNEKINVSNENEKLSNELLKQNEKIKEFQALKICLEDKIKEIDQNLKLSIEENAKLTIHNQKLLSNNSDTLNTSLKEELSKYKTKIQKVLEENSNLNTEMKQYKDEINTLKQEIIQLKNVNEQVSLEKSYLEQKLSESSNELENEMTKMKENLNNQIEELSMEKSHLKKQLNQTIAESSNEKQELENNLFEIKQKLGETQNENSDLKLQLNLSIESSVNDLKKNEKIFNKSKEELEEQIKIQNEKLNELEEAHRLKIKQLVIDFEKQLAKTKEESFSDKEKFLDSQENYEGQQMRELREQIKNLESELEERHLYFENHEQKTNSKFNEFKTQTKELEAALERANAARIKELAECESRWRNCLEREVEQERSRHQEQLQILQNQWEWERSTLKSNGNSELQNTSQIAVKAIESGSGSFEMLQQQFIAQSQELKEVKRQHRLEIQELKKFHSIKQKASGSNELEDATELEYLRNILYEYMLGREPLVLAKVISAVVKFDNEQTNKILQKEEQKLTLLGHLGLL